MNKSKVTIAVNKTMSGIQMFIGIILLSIFAPGTIITLTDRESSADAEVGLIIFCLCMCVSGTLLVASSVQNLKLAEKFKQYVAAVSNNPDGYIPNIAASLGVSENVVKKNLDLMIKRKYFANAFIDMNSNCIVIANKPNANVNTAQQPQVKAQQPQTNTNTYTSPAASQTIEMVTVKCKGCGGINTIQKGAVGECDYCGSSIKGE